jgi:hypothetical protein
MKIKKGPIQASLNIEVEKIYENISCKGTEYIGSAIIPKLIARGYKVDILDLYWFDNGLLSLGSLCLIKNY